MAQFSKFKMLFVFKKIEWAQFYREISKFGYLNILQIILKIVQKSE